MHRPYVCKLASDETPVDLLLALKYCLSEDFWWPELVAYLAQPGDLLLVTLNDDVCGLVIVRSHHLHLELHMSCTMKV